MWTLNLGQEILVGISSRTNKEGAECLQRAFPEFKVRKIPVTDTFHLKNIVTLAEEGLLVVKGDSTNSEYLKVSGFILHAWIQIVCLNYISLCKGDF